jgi:hypothetical protein
MTSSSPWRCCCGGTNRAAAEASGATADAIEKISPKNARRALPRARLRPMDLAILDMRLGDRFVWPGRCAHRRGVPVPFITGLFGHTPPRILPRCCRAIQQPVSRRAWPSELHSSSLRVSQGCCGARPIRSPDRAQQYRPVDPAVPRALRGLGAAMKHNHAGACAGALRGVTALDA